MPQNNKLLKGKIFIHRRHVEKTLISRSSLDAIFFECFIQNKNYSGWFIQLYAQPADHVRVLYSQHKDTSEIHTLYNESQDILHMRIPSRILGSWTFTHQFIPNSIKVFIGLFSILFLLFSAASLSSNQFDLMNIAFDSLYFSLFGVFLFSLFFIPFIGVYYFWIHRQTLRKLKLLELSPAQILHIEKFHSDIGIYDFKNQFAITLKSHTNVNNG